MDFPLYKQTKPNSDQVSSWLNKTELETQLIHASLDSTDGKIIDSQASVSKYCRLVCFKNQNYMLSNLT